MPLSLQAAVKSRWRKEVQSFQEQSFRRSSIAFTASDARDLRQAVPPEVR